MICIYHNHSHITRFRIPSASQAVEVAKEAVRCAREPGKLTGVTWDVGIPELVM